MIKFILYFPLLPFVLGVATGTMIGLIFFVKVGGLVIPYVS